jgi:hypothetical protein
MTLQASVSPLINGRLWSELAESCRTTSGSASAQSRHWLSSGIRLLPTQVHRWCACQAIPEPDLQNVAAADCSAPRWSFSRLLLLAQSGHLSARSSRPPSVESPRPVRIPEWPRCASSRPKWTLRTDGLAAVCRAASCHGASTRLRVAPPEHCKGPLWDRSLSPAWTYVKIVVLRFAGRLRTQNWVALRAEPLALHSE